jgi:DNA-binding response OmpR family regulator
MPRSILVVEDNQELARLLEIHLHDLSYEVELAFDGHSGLAKAQTKKYDLIILDIMLPGLDGLEICRRVRGKDVYTPILILTSKASELERQESKEAIVKVKNLVIDSQRRRVSLKGKTVDLTAKEFDLLHHFAQHPGRVFSRSQLLDMVWSYGHDGYEHTVNSHINRLRAKIEDNPSHPEYILTVWGVGYKFAEIEDR